MTADEPGADGDIEHKGREHGQPGTPDEPLGWWPYASPEEAEAGGLLM